AGTAGPSGDTRAGPRRSHRRLRAPRVPGDAGRGARRRPDAQRPRAVRRRHLPGAGGLCRPRRPPGQRLGLAGVPARRRAYRLLRRLGRDTGGSREAQRARARGGGPWRGRQTASRWRGDPVAQRQHRPEGESPAVPHRGRDPAPDARPRRTGRRPSQRREGRLATGDLHPADGQNLRTPRSPGGNRAWRPRARGLRDLPGGTRRRFERRSVGGRPLHRRNRRCRGARPEALPRGTVHTHAEGRWL
ncbi:MAG: hypothetical protein AVDCRST_MAG01-01-3685, partial [uncultured Rubrobacteraceae bacterium]